MRTKTVGIRELKNRLSEFIQGVARSGQEVLITDRGRVVARLTTVLPRVSTAREPMKIRPAVLDHSDLSWMRRPLPKGERPISARDIMDALDFTREDKEV